MKNQCKIYRCMQKIRGGCHCNAAFMGGSVTVATGASNNASTTWRRLFYEFLYTQYHHVYHTQPGEIMCAIGAMESFAGVYLVERNITPHNPDIVFIEFCLNDRGSPDRMLVKKANEGIVRQLKSIEKNLPDVVFVGAGSNPDGQRGPADHSLHKEIADYYGLGFIDVQSYMYKKLEERGQKWTDITVRFLNDDTHLNDYGNQLWFEAMRDWFLEQEKLFVQQQSTGPNPFEMPKPLHSDELQYTKLINPMKKNKMVQKEGSWQAKSQAVVPWYMDNLCVGRPGDKMTLTFTGTAVGLWALVHQNGLKIEAKLDGKEIAGPFTHFKTHQFGKFFTMGHAMENTEHVLELEVAKPSPKLNKLEDPTAEIAYLAIAQPPK